MARPPRAERPALKVITTRLTDEELAALDRLRLPGEARADAFRRLLARVTYAADLARALAARAPGPAADDPRKDAARGTSIIYPVGQDRSVPIRVVDARTGVTLHEETAPPAPPTPEPRELAEPTRRDLDLVLALFDLVEGRPPRDAAQTARLRNALALLGTATEP